jgi:large subunit ribosomal protein L31
MKDNIHPNYQKAKVTCSCGNTFEVGSTVSEINVEICSACHPFFTGKEKLVDTAGRVDKFRARQEAAAKFKEAKSKSADKELFLGYNRSRKRNQSGFFVK